jgi:ADP-heptose:LPS heptosyltransferase
MRLQNLEQLYQRTRDAKKIVVVDLGVLGDTLQLVPALWELKQHYPAAVLHVLSSPLGSEALRLAPCVERVWPLHISRATRTWREHCQVIRALRREQYSLAFNFIGNDRGTILTGLTGASCRVAHAAGRQHFWNRWLVPNWVLRQDKEQAVFEQHRQVLAACGLNLGPVRFDLSVGPQEQALAAQLVPAGAIHLSINSGNPFKECPVEFNAQLLKALWVTHTSLQVVASAGPKPRERERLQKLASLVNDSRLIPLTQNLSITELAAVLARCRLHLGPDSGAMHLAAALNTPTVSFFREQGDFKCWLPRGPTHRVLSVPCKCIDHQNAPCERLGYADCLAQISPTQAQTLVSELLVRAQSVQNHAR